MKFLRIAWLVVAALAVSLLAVALPMSVFVVHCEPTRANPMMWEQLVDLVRQADVFAIPLTIDFTPQWADMILEDPQKMDALENWIDVGHEIGCHHHGYWGTKEHGSTWDGYTNTLLEDLDSTDRTKFLGTMDDYMTRLNALPGERRSGCMGSEASADAVDYPCQLEYSTQGHALEDAVATPELLIRNGCSVTEIGHGLIASQTRGALQAFYLATSETAVFGVNGHVYNYADFPMLFIEWFRFLHEMDEIGDFRRTVSGLLDAWQADIE